MMTKGNSIKAWHQMSAVDAVKALKNGSVTPLELVKAARDRIEQVDGSLNAVPTRCFERAEARALKLMKKGNPKNPSPGYLYGLPILVKDTIAVKDVLLTFGSLIYKDNVAAKNDPVVDILERKGAIVIGKSNTPEFGLGSNTYNTIFGDTCNPFRTNLTSGGSSGGASAALASGEIWLAVGTDLGGSLRIPASFCNIVGLRPSPGRVPNKNAISNEEPALHAVVGPMARNVSDLALFMDSMFEHHPADKYSLPAPDMSFMEILQVHEEHLPKRVAWSPTLGGITPVEAEVIDICQQAAHWYESINAKVFEACMDLSQCAETFQILRAEMFQESGWVLNHADKVKPELIWQVQKGLNLEEKDLLRARQNHKELIQNVGKFFEEYDILCSPCVMVPPFDVKLRWLKDCAGVTFDNYVDWLLPTSALSLTNCPSISIPCGFTKSGLPIGLQIVSKPFSEAQLLCAAYAFENAHNYLNLVPIDPVNHCKL